jgi:hypothetical protein
MTHEAVPARESLMASFVVAVVLFMVNLTMEQDVFYASIGKVAKATNH